MAEQPRNADSPPDTGAGKPAKTDSGQTGAITAIYQGVVMDHGRAPRRRRALNEATHRGSCRNRLCGDEVGVALVLDGQTVVDIAFEGKGCAVMLAAASTLCEAVAATRVDGIAPLTRAFCGTVTGVVNGDDDHEHGASLDLAAPLDAFVALAPHPSRHRCATLPWEALQLALGDGKPTLD